MPRAGARWESQTCFATSDPAVPGSYDDLISAGDGFDIILGDHGFFQFHANGDNPPTLYLIESKQTDVLTAPALVPIPSQPDQWQLADSTWNYVSKREDDDATAKH